MLILQRKEGQSLLIGDNISITVHEIGMGRVRLAIDAPREVSVLRSELVEAGRENRAAAAEQHTLIDLLALLGDGVQRATEAKQIQPSDAAKPHHPPKE